MKRFIALMLVSLLIAGCSWSIFKQKKSRGGGAQSVTVTEGTIQETVEATGSVLPRNRVEVRPPMSGRIEKLLVDEGSRVEAGQTLAWMSSSDRAAILDSARSQGEETLRKWEDAYKPIPIIAPLSGVVILRNVVIGQTVDASSVLFAMSDYLNVVGQVDESDIGRVKIGMPAVITLDSYPDQPVTGKVSDILYEGKNVSNVITYGVKVKLDKVPSFFRSQMTANISFIVKKKEEILMLPLNAVRDMPDGTKAVFVPGKDGKQEKREVMTGVETIDHVEVLSGLAAGDRVLITRARYVPQEGAQSSPLTPGSRRNSGRNQRGR